MVLKAPRYSFGQWMPPGRAIHLLEVQLTHRLPLHWHEFYEISFIRSGEGLHLYNGRKRELKRGSLFLLTPADFHEIVPKEGQPLDVYNVIFADSVLDQELARMVFRQSDVLEAVMKHPDRIEAEYGRMLWEMNSNAVGRERIIRGVLDRLLIELARNGRPEPACEEQVPVSEPIRQALLFVQRQFRESVTLEGTAKQAGLNPNYFSERFKKELGVSFMQYVQQLRLHFSMRLLAVSDLPVTEVCLVSGFNSLPHYERVFKTMTGLTPRSYRKEKQNK